MTRPYSRRRFWWILAVLVPLVFVLHGRVPDYALPDDPAGVETLASQDAPDWQRVTRIGRLIARVPHARIVFPTALILSVWLLTIMIAWGRDVYFRNRDKRAETSLYNELVNSSRVGYCAATSTGTIEACNVALSEMLGAGQQQIVGRNLDEFGLSLDRLVAGDVTALSLTPPGGEALPVLAAAMEGDEEVGLQVIVAPFPGTERGGAATDHKQLDAVKREFLRSLNHELRTPLTVILGSATILESDVSEGNADLVGAIKEGGERLLHVLEATMLLSELEASDPDEIAGAVEIGAVVREAAGEFGLRAKDKSLEFLVEVPDELIFASADPRGVRQIVAQLLDNAVKFTGEGAIRVSAGRSGGRVWVAVQDTGRGIDPTLLPVAVSDFRRGPQSGRAASGIGLGLARLIAERMDGRLNISSTPGVGTRVEVHLPDASAADTPDANGSIAA